MEGDLSQAVSQEMARLKSMETTLELIQQSAHKQLTHHLSSSKKQDRQPLGSLSDIKVNLLGQFDEIERQEGPEIEADPSVTTEAAAEQLKTTLLKGERVLEAIRQEKRTAKGKDAISKEVERRKLNKELDLLRKVMDLERHLRRNQGQMRSI